jgi:hypothetical protein
VPLAFWNLREAGVRLPLQQRVAVHAPGWDADAYVAAGSAPADAGVQLLGPFACKLSANNASAQPWNRLCFVEHAGTLTPFFGKQVPYEVAVAEKVRRCGGGAGGCAYPVPSRTTTQRARLTKLCGDGRLQRMPCCAVPRCAGGCFDAAAAHSPAWQHAAAGGGCRRWCSTVGSCRCCWCCCCCWCVWQQHCTDVQRSHCAQPP